MCESSWNQTSTRTIFNHRFLLPHNHRVKFTVSSFHCTKEKKLLFFPPPEARRLTNRRTSSGFTSTCWSRTQTSGFTSLSTHTATQTHIWRNTCKCRLTIRNTFTQPTHRTCVVLLDISLGLDCVSAVMDPRRHLTLNWKTSSPVSLILQRHQLGNETTNQS